MENDIYQKIEIFARLARLDKPVGIWLLYIPCCFGLILAQYTGPKLYILFLIGAVVMRSAGCVINDILDRKLDAKVERTKNRPLASGELEVKHAWIFLLGLLLTGLLILLTLPKITFLLGLIIIPFVLLYPLMKRITYWPQLFLGITFNFGLIMAYSAVTGEITLAPIIAYIGCIFWTLGYDTLYALQDIEDDLEIGIKSTALGFGENWKFYVFAFYMVFLLSISHASGLAGLTDGYFTISLVVAAAMLLWQINHSDPKKPANCLNSFRANIVVGLTLLAGLLKF